MSGKTSGQLVVAQFSAQEEMLVFAAPRLQLTLIPPRNISNHLISLNDRKNEVRISGKGQNELFEILNPLEPTRVATNSV
jgi:hypothetical protein